MNKNSNKEQDKINSRQHNNKQHNKDQFILMHSFTMTLEENPRILKKKIFIDKNNITLRIIHFSTA